MLVYFYASFYNAHVHTYIILNYSNLSIKIFTGHFSIDGQFFIMSVNTAMNILVSYVIASVLHCF